MKTKYGKAILAVLGVMAFATASFAGIIPPDFSVANVDPLMAIGLAGVGSIEIKNISDVIKQITGIENSMAEFQKQAKDEIEANGKVTDETVNKLDNLGVQQKEIADRLLEMEQSGGAGGSEGSEGMLSIGAQFTKSDVYAAFADGQSAKARFEIQNNTSTGSDTTVAPDRKAAIVPGASENLTLEQLLVSLPTASNAIEYTREATLVNNAAEVLEAGARPETDITFDKISSPVRTIGHFTKISRELAKDAPALAAYINFRMRYGVNKRTETQIGAGDGTGANLSGLTDSGNFTAHGIADAALGSVLKKHVLIRKVIAQLESIGYEADAILLNPIDAADMEIEAATTANVKGIEFGIPVVKSNAITQDTFQVGAYRQAATVHNRESIIVELSESDGSNFTEGLVTIRAERRLALTIEVPAALQGGDLTPV